MTPTISDLRAAFFGAGPDDTVSDAEYQQLQALYTSGITLAQIASGAHPPALGGASSLDREDVRDANVALVSQRLQATYFIAPRSFTATRVNLTTGTTAAAAAPTLVRAGIYEEEADGDLVLVASIPNDTTIFAAANTEYTRNLSAPYNVLAGKRFAFGILVVTGVAPPSLNGVLHPAAMLSGNKQQPTIASSITGQADLPANVSFASLTGAVGRFYAQLLPA